MQRLCKKQAHDLPKTSQRNICGARIYLPLSLTMCLEHVTIATTTKVLLTVFCAEQIRRKKCFPVPSVFGCSHAFDALFCCSPTMIDSHTVFASAALRPVTALARVGSLLGQGTGSFLGNTSQCVVFLVNKNWTNRIFALVPARAFCFLYISDPGPYLFPGKIIAIVRTGDFFVHPNL